MSQRKKQQPHEHAAVAASFDDLVKKRRARHRQANDGQGVDISIGSLGARLEATLDKLSKDTKARMLVHVRTHVDEAMKPILRAVERDHGADEVNFLRDVGPQMLRTIMEYLEEQSTQS